ncbi:MAG: SDR family oxidoreductase [Burkholderiales bacterium]|nr:SDR family oxidoreductase [Burkholderiales bacterium]OUT78793.1 MAG: short-chain dehydrogenase [Betaproteobacteria bacterium TMED22]|tara:strand:+ start:56497 stop:57273 length:777 start_codon:yes stop_codon:yes gene_type:complete
MPNSKSFFRLDNKVAVITGASRGIGRSIAIAYARYGAKVIVSSRKIDVCEEVVNEIRSIGGEATATAANISEKSSLEELVDFSVSTYGGIDILVCNAASNPFYGELKDIPDEAFEKVLKNNILSNHWLSALVSPHMSKRNGGSILIVSSIAGLKGSPGLGAYAVSKAADMQLIRNLAIELGDKRIKVNGIAPGLIKTDFAKALWENSKIRSHYEEKTALKRIGDPDDIAGVALFLASGASSYVTGQTIVADGGITING